MLDGDSPSFVDMPTWYTHNITNIGNDVLYTIFWINESYDKDDPDTFLKRFRLNYEKIKVLSIVGTRPELIRLSRVFATLDENVNHIIVHTGQNYDYELNKIFFEELEIKKPDYYLDVDTNSLGKVLGNILIKIEEVLLKEKPDAVLILGDTNSSISAIMAKRLHIPIYHMEAGNRSLILMFLKKLIGELLTTLLTSI